MKVSADLKVVRGACPHDCPDTCAFLYHVDGDKLVEVTGDPAHPMTRGGLCVKLKDFAQHHYNPERVLYPMRRVGPKGAGEFERISWDEALGEIKRRWDGIIATHGAEAIMPHAYLGHQGTLNGLTAGDAFFNRLGSSVAEKTYCESGSSTAWLMTVGPTGGLDVESLAYAKYIIVWGMNMISTNLHAWPFILEAQAKGAKVVVIDPVRTRTAKAADWHIAIKPGTDAALALGMMNVIIAEGLVDQDYVEKYTLGFEELKGRAAEFPPERVAEITGIPAEDVRKLAREYATTQPSAIRQGVALERSRGGGQAIRAITCLPALVGAWRHVGGGTVEMPIWEFPTRFDRICRPDWIKPGTRVINELDLGAALTGELALDPPVMSLFVYNSNPVSQAPSQAKIVKGLQREDLFMVVSELFITDTAKFADLILPATMQGEQYDLMVTWGHLYMMLNQPAIPAPGECIPNVELFRRLAKTMGFDDDYWNMTDDEMLLEFYDWSAPQLQGITLDLLKEKGWMRLNVGAPGERAPHAEGGFKTPSGKCEFKSSLAEGGDFVVPVWRSMYEGKQSGDPVDPLPAYIPPFESPASNPTLAQDYPLKHRLAQAACVLEHAVRQRGAEEAAPGRADRVPASARCGGSGDRGGQRGAGLQRARILRGAGRAQRGSDARASSWPMSAIGRARPSRAPRSTRSAPIAHCGMGKAGTYSDNLVQVVKAATGGSAAHA